MPSARSAIPTSVDPCQRSCILSDCVEIALLNARLRFLRLRFLRLEKARCSQIFGLRF